MEKLKPHVGERAADLLGRGWSQRAVCAELGISRSSITRLRRDPVFRAKEQRARDAQLEEAPTARAVLEAGLRATDRFGHPDWATRTRCALALTQLPPEEHAPWVPEVIREEVFADRIAP